jgi:hypothetical protein
VPVVFQDDIVSFKIYSPSEKIYNEATVSVDEYGLAESSPLTLDDDDSPEGIWTVFATVNDSISTGEFHSIGNLGRNFQFSYFTPTSTTSPTTPTSTPSHPTTPGPHPPEGLAYIFIIVGGIGIIVLLVVLSRKR